MREWCRSSSSGPRPRPTCTPCLSRWSTRRSASLHPRLRPEPVTVLGKVPLEDRLQHLPQRRLHHPVPNRRNPQRPFSVATRLGYPYPADRLWTDIVPSRSCSRTVVSGSSQLALEILHLTGDLPQRLPGWLSLAQEPRQSSWGPVTLSISQTICLLRPPVPGPSTSVPSRPSVPPMPTGPDLSRLV